jgi:uncharacterized protein YabE (DUF348 family)/3D (Asp-Asp-Asp) domain-containing protein
VVLVLAVAGFRLFPQQDVTVVRDGQPVRVTAVFERSEALAAADVSLQPGDRVVGGQAGKYLSLAIQRARPVVVEADGVVLQLRSQASTIAGALAETGVELKPGDRVYLEDQRATVNGPLYAPSMASRRIPTAQPPRDPAAPIRIRVDRARPFTVLVDSMAEVHHSAAYDVRDLLLEMGLTVREGDLVVPPLDTVLQGGEVIELAKARKITVRVDGQEQTLYTRAETVADVVTVLGLTLGPDDVVSPSLATVVEPGMSVELTLTRVVQEEVTVDIPPPINREQDPSLPYGQVKEIIGTPGALVRKYAVTYRGGKETAREEVGHEVVLEPVATRVIIGSYVPPRPAAAARPAAAGGQPVAGTLEAPGYSGSYVTKVTVDATWYTAEHGAWEAGSPHWGTTRSGMRAGYGVCATDPDFIPMYTRMYIPGYGECIAGDTGGAIKGWKIDLGFPDGTVDSGWGYQRGIEIYILEWGGR